jgi:hypothetical protein
MLPRLRFVFVAALIAAVPWILFGTGVVTTAQNTPVSEFTRAGTGVAISAGDLRDSHHMHALAYVRRSRELERLREMATSPLSEWVAAPAGLAASEPAATETPATMAPATALVEAPQAQSESVPEITVVASLPAEPTPETPTVASPAAIAPEALAPPYVAPVPTAGDVVEAAVQASVNVTPNLSHVDWSKVVPPLPRVRTGEETRKATGRRLRKRVSISPAPQVQPNPFRTEPNPFGGPPAMATTHNAGRNSGVTP